MSKTEIEVWPALPLADWQETYHSLHMWSQMVGKVRLALAPRANHWWGVPLYVTARGLTTSPMPYGTRSLEIAFDFLDHVLRIDLTHGVRREIPLVSQSVARFYEQLTTELAHLGLQIKIWPVPCEVPEPVRFSLDTRGAYDAESAQRFWRILTQVDRVLKEFRARFLGKCSPVHFFWGSFDLAVTRFSGRRAPPFEGADSVSREGYSHECSSAGFWPGSGTIRGPAFYSYTSPQPEGFDRSVIRPPKAYYAADAGLGEFIYMYDDMRAAPEPDLALLEFLQSTYEAGANLGAWDRSELERPMPSK
jgi:hypothetical protein